MASFIIPEDIIPGGLFVPDANNFFEIGAGSLPNGEDSLVVRGDLSRDYKAFQRAPVVSPSLFRDKNVVGWAMSFWIKLPAVTSTKTGHMSEQILFAPMARTTVNNSTPASDGLIVTTPVQSGSLEVPHMTWAVTRYYSTSSGSHCKLGFINQLRRRTSGTTAQGNGISWNTPELTPDTWHQIVINIPSPLNTPPTGYVNTTPVAGTYHSGVTSLADVTNTDPTYMCIGSYSDLNAMNAPDNQWEIAKLAFHGAPLTLTDVAMLYDAMTL